MLFIEQNVNFNKSERQSKMENLPHAFRGMKLPPQLIQESSMKSKTAGARKRKKSAFLVTVHLLRGNIF